MIALVLPLKNFIHAKQRLSGVLTANERHNLFQAMVEDILLQVSLCEQIDKVLIVSNDVVAELLAQKYNFDCIPERATGLNAAVAQARDWISQQALFENSGKMLVLHGDLPLLSHTALTNFIQYHPSELILATDHQGIGTNALLLPVSNHIDFQYGEGSCQKHLQQAKAHHLTHTKCLIPSLALDIDEPHDLLSVIHILDKNHEVAPKTAKYLNESGIAKRIRHLELTPPCSVNLISLADMDNPIAMTEATGMETVYG